MTKLLFVNQAVLIENIFFLALILRVGYIIDVAIEKRTNNQKERIVSNGRNKLAADWINGVYNSEIPTDGKPLVDDAFLSALKDVKDGETIYGDVSDEIAEKIEVEYGIR